MNKNIVHIKEHFGVRLQELFSNCNLDSKIIKRGFATTEALKKDSILFLGLNPSYTQQNEPDKQENIFYNLQQRGNYKYFKRFEDISEYTGLNWSHLDLLTVRETNQNNMVALTKTPKGLDFIWKHLLLSQEILELSTPRVLVVANTVARTYLGKDSDSKGHNKWLGYNFKFDPLIGTHRVTNTESSLKGTPVFFTSMLTGQRALDNGSYERLKWQIRRILDQ